MPDPEFENCLEDDITVYDSEPRHLLIKLADRQVSAAYWEGRCEGLEIALDHIKQSHDMAIKQMAEGHELTVAYLKDRLNRLEARRDGETP